MMLISLIALPMVAGRIPVKPTGLSIMQETILIPATFYNRLSIGRIGFLVKAKDGTGDKKSQDILAEVGLFQVNLTSPLQNSATILASGASLTIAANNTNGNASYNLKANGISINTNAATANYTFTHTNITTNQSYELVVTQGAITITKNFTAIVNPGTVSENLPTGLEDWQPTLAYAMKKDPTTGKFWLELTGLTFGQNYTYQYWVVKETPIANSPRLVKTADPYSTLVLSPFDDPGIPAASYPNLPVYPAGQEREVTVLKTGQTPYNWQVTNFAKPDKDNLVVLKYSYSMIKNKLFLRN